MFTIVLCKADSLLCFADIATLRSNKGGASEGLRWLPLGWGIRACTEPSPARAHDIYFYGDREEIGKEARAGPLKGKAVTWGNLRLDGPLQFLSLLLLNSKLQTDLRTHRCPLCLFSGSLVKTSVNGLYLFFHRLLRRKWKCKVDATKVSKKSK